MSYTTFQSLARAEFIVDKNSLVVIDAPEIDWDSVDAVRAETYSEHTTKVIPAGTVMCKLASGKMIPRADRENAETAIGILWKTAVELQYFDPSMGESVIAGGPVFETLLPEVGSADLDATVKAELNAAGTGFVFVEYTQTLS